MNLLVTFILVIMQFSTSSEGILLEQIQSLYHKCQPFVLDVRNVWACLTFLVIILGLFLQNGGSKQRLVPGIPVVGGSDRESIKKQRKRFIHDSKAMIIEGYKKVTLLDSLALIQY